MSIIKYIGYFLFLIGFLLTLLNKKPSRTIKNYALSALGYLCIIISMKATPHITNNMSNIHMILNTVQTAKTFINKK